LAKGEGSSYALSLSSLFSLVSSLPFYTPPSLTFSSLPPPLSLSSLSLWLVYLNLALLSSLHLLLYLFFSVGRLVGEGG
jgi:hypothetical protein